MESVVEIVMESWLVVK